MHVLITAHDLYPDPGSGGTGRYVYETARRLVDRGHHVSVITRRRGDVPARDRIEGIDVRRYDVAIAGESAPSIAAQLPGAVAAVARAVDDLGATRGTGRGGVDVLSFQGPVTSSLAHLAADGGIPRTCTFHSPWPTEYRIRAGHEATIGPTRRRLNARLRRAIEARVLDACDDVVTLSGFMADELRRVYGAGTASPTVVPGGVDTDRYSPNAGPFDPMDTADGVSLLTVRRLSPRMGHGILLEAFARVRERHPDAELYVAGDGPLRAELEEAAGRLGVGGATTFLGYVPDADLPAVYASADVFVLPTLRLEGFGLATLEALASGTPVVGTAVGGTVEILAEYADGAAAPADPLVPEPTVDALAEAMADWAALSPEERAAAGRACRRRTEERFTWERTVDALEGRYEALARP
ncbi:glycosyltransferase family 4 protein [Halomarina halobia]|uniref:Glycosyltransferase family 4 protein n=1 Tax=Halomarina halobia TaxID=3033386 RepID=A0ABD6ADH7_9EURY|nr:glycosyltransferase family 4 protein [Halomarina sp. PSR21]